LHRTSGFSSPNLRAVTTKEVALKVIPKKKVKGNEEAVWGEMEVLKGLDHPNIVRFCHSLCFSLRNVNLLPCHIS
jgi:calcium/calmodulin-dependent protein kinase I